MDTTQEYILMNQKLPLEIIKKHEWQAGDFYAGIKGVCPHDDWWKQCQPEWTSQGKEPDYWKRIQHARDGEISWGTCEESSSPNFKVNCGCYEYGEIWPLLRQDQLQEMVPLFVLPGQLPTGEISAGYLEKFNTFQWNHVMYSMEQLWLAFVMHEKFSKQWSIEGKKWEVINDK